MGSLNSGRSFGPSTKRAPITGTVSKKTEPHQKYWISIPPTRGPIAAPAEKLDIHTPIAAVRWFGSLNMLRMRDSVEGAIVAPETPRRALETMSISVLVEKAANTDVSAKVIAPIRSRRRRPILSPRFPSMISDPATKKP